MNINGTNRIPYAKGRGATLNQGTKHGQPAAQPPIARPQQDDVQKSNQTTPTGALANTPTAEELARQCQVERMAYEGIVEVGDTASASETGAVAAPKEYDFEIMLHLFAKTHWETYWFQWTDEDGVEHQVSSENASTKRLPDMAGYDEEELWEVFESWLRSTDAFSFELWTADNSCVGAKCPGTGMPPESHRITDEENAAILLRLEMPPEEKTDTWIDTLIERSIQFRKDIQRRAGTAGALQAAGFSVKFLNQYKASLSK